MKYYSLFSLCFMMSLSSFAGPLMPWKNISDPNIMDKSFKRNFNELPLVGEVSDKKKYWSGDFWPRNRGGINYRWNSPSPEGFKLISPSKQKVKQMGPDEVATLAPSEKWDIFLGRYDYPTKNEVAAYVSPRRPDWEGICNGWVAAAFSHNEPVGITVTNNDGIEIHFGSSDVKALLSWYYAKKAYSAYDQMGRRCRPGKRERCSQDLNAGAFHIVLTNKIGIKGKTFLADIDPRSEVWNHIPVQYQSQVVEDYLPPLSTSAPKTKRVLKLKTKIRYVSEQAENSNDPILGTEKQKYVLQSYEYYLDLDEKGNILGGKWISVKRPDYLWLARKMKTFSGNFQRLNELLTADVKDSSLNE